MNHRMLTWVASAALAVGFALSTQAAGITGGISFAGGPVTTDTGNLATATTITSFGSVAVVNANGSYNNVPFLQSVNMLGFTFLPSLNPSPVLNEWSFTPTIGADAGKTFSFDFTTVQTLSQGTDVNGNGFLDISGLGVLHISGLSDTLGTYIVTANSAGNTFSFSSSAMAITPDGGMTVMLLGAALSGLALFRRKLA